MVKAYDNLFLAYTSLIRDVENDILEDDDKAGNSIQCDENWFESMNQAHYALIQKSDNALKSWSLAQSMGRKFNQTHLKKIYPPTFKGNIVEYPDFLRKWKTQVGRAGWEAD